MNSFTQGPWTVHKSNAHHISYIIRGGDNQNQIAQTFNWQDKSFDISSEANARLIAAAPDLLGFAKWVLSLKTDGGIIDDRAREVIAKAEGQ